MTRESRLTREEKGKAAVDPSSPTADLTANGSPLDEFSLLHRNAARNAAGSDLSDGDVDDEGSEEGGPSRSASQSGGSDREGGSDSDSYIPSPQTLWERHRRVRFDQIECRPTVYCPDGTFQELSPLPPGLLRDPWFDGQRWGNVFATRSNHSSVRDLLRRYKGVGVTYIIPSAEQRPWSPPIGYQCLYESYFEDHGKLWFPIPRLITSYVRRRGVAISQLKIGSIRNAVMLMVMAAELDISMTVRVFEELTTTKAEADCLFSVKMRPSYNVLTGHPRKTTNWQRSYFYIRADEQSFEEPLEDDFPARWVKKIGRDL